MTVHWLWQIFICNYLPMIREVHPWAYIYKTSQNWDVRVYVFSTVLQFNFLNSSSLLYSDWFVTGYERPTRERHINPRENLQEKSWPKPSIFPKKSVMKLLSLNESPNSFFSHHPHSLQFSLHQSFSYNHVPLDVLPFLLSIFMIPFRKQMNYFRGKQNRMGTSNNQYS